MTESYTPAYTSQAPRDASKRMRELLADRDLIWLPLVYGRDQLPPCSLSIALGGHVRVGIGDHHYGESGQPTNADLVESVVEIIRARGREPASIAEARAYLGIEAPRP